jgi:hypothetical protein
MIFNIYALFHSNFFASLQSVHFDVIQIIYDLGHKLKLSIFTVPYVTILTFAHTWHLYCF